MNILLDPVPTTIEISGSRYEINSDYRISILFEMLLMDPEVPDSQKLYQGLQLYYPAIPNDIQGAIERVLWFYRCGKELERETGSGRRQNPIYSYDYDDAYIYAAFLDQYGIDLQDVAYLHWWKFKALFQGLKPDNEIVKIMGYRAMEIPNGMSREQKEHYRKMKKLYVIPLPKSEQEKISAIEEALMNGGDLSGLL